MFSGLNSHQCLVPLSSSFFSLANCLCSWRHTLSTASWSNRVTWNLSKTIFYSASGTHARMAKIYVYRTYRGPAWGSLAMARDVSMCSVFSLLRAGTSISSCSSRRTVSAGGSPSL